MAVTAALAGISDILLMTAAGVCTRVSPEWHYVVAFSPTVD